MFQRIIFNIFKLTTTEAMLSCESRFAKIELVFYALYFENDVGSPQFFGISDIGNSFSDCRKSVKEICVVEDFRANVLKVTRLK